ncbi:MAG: YaiI/YqxD family protein [Clostridia bacterium]|nr:YaiI/YqxD family protein [Clostridia bacterium]
MKVYVDADACPVTRIAERVAKEHSIPVVLLCDTNHVLYSNYSEIRVIGAGADAVDIALINLCQRGDIVVTQDYGVAALALGKGAKAIHQSGLWYTDENIDGLLMERHMAKVARRRSKNHLKGPAKRTDEDDRRFEESLRKLIETCESDKGKDAVKP